MYLQNVLKYATANEIVQESIQNFWCLTMYIRDREGPWIIWWVINAKNNMHHSEIDYYF